MATQNLGPGIANLGGRLTRLGLSAQDNILLQMPDQERRKFKLNQKHDEDFRTILSRFGLITGRTGRRMTSKTIYERNNFANVRLAAHAAGSGPGAAVTYTVMPGSHNNTGTAGLQTANIYPECVYSFKDPNGLWFEVKSTAISQATAGANTITLVPSDATRTLPAILDDHPIMLIGRAVGEANTSHIYQNVTFSMFATEHRWESTEWIGQEFTDHALIDDLAWVESTVQAPIVGTNGGSPTVTTTNVWYHETIDKWYRQWRKAQSASMLIGTGETAPVAGNNYTSTIPGVFPFILNNGGQVFPFTGTITTADWRDMTRTLDQIGDFGSVNEYFIMPGRNVYIAIQDFLRGSHIAGQQIPLVQSEMYLDFMEFTLDGYKFYLPAEKYNQLDYEGGLGDMGFSDIAMFIPMGMSSITDSLGNASPFFEYQVLMNEDSFAKGFHGAETWSWQAGPSFSNNPIFSQGHIIKIQDNVVRCTVTQMMKENHKIPQNFALMTP